MKINTFRLQYQQIFDLTNISLTSFIQHIPWSKNIKDKYVEIQMQDFCCNTPSIFKVSETKSVYE